MFFKEKKNTVSLKLKWGKTMFEMSPRCLDLISIKNIKLDAKKKFY